ncbi:MAG: DUF4292 domain-containing protein [Balneolaceae bacterium]
MNFRLPLLSLIVISMGITACSTSRTISTGDFSPSNTSADELVSALPNYEDELQTIAGKGRALVSEPGNSERVTIDFEANEELSMLTIKNRIGIEGGQMLVDQDSILIYSKVDKMAQKISIYDGRMTSLNELASVNILDLLNFKVDTGDVEQVLEDNNYLQLRLSNGAEILINKADNLIWQVEQTVRGVAPYSRIVYEGYGEIEGYTLPRKITIFSANGDSKVAFLIRSLEINPAGLHLHIDVPNDIIIERL